MIKIYKTNSLNRIEKLNDFEVDSWINLVSPTEDEIDRVVNETKVSKDLIIKMLDDEERPRIEIDEDSKLIVIDTPLLEDSDGTLSYITIPLGIIINHDYLITVSLKNINLLSDFKKEKVKSFKTKMKTRFIIQILLKTANSYLKALDKIYRQIEVNEEKLDKSTSNNDILNMLDIEKTLVYFITALKANDVVLERLNKGNIIKLFEEDLELLDDAIIENKQAIETSIVYREILSSITDTYASIVSNNLNNVMKFLAGATIVLSVPTMIFSFFGMNVKLGFFEINSFSAIIILVCSLLLSLIIALILRKRNML